MNQSSSEYLLNFLQNKKSSICSSSVNNNSQQGNVFRDDDSNIRPSKYVDTGFTEDILIHKMYQGNSALHEVALPPGVSTPPYLKPVANEEKLVAYPFTLDEFQERAVLCIHNHHSVLVSAHTSAGKTVVAEYGIARALRDHQRVIYTTPIKALSNQKFHEFGAKYGSTQVGLMTGDVTENVDANIIVMTTEILRLMIYHGSPVTREVGWVVFDEVHYLRDPGRGHVWEETISLLAPQVRQIFLSATIPNASEFAKWIVSLNCTSTESTSELTEPRVSRHQQQCCHVIYTEFRPTPLQHYLCLPSQGNAAEAEVPRFELVLNEAREFLQEAFDDFVQKLETQVNSTAEAIKSIGQDTSNLENDAVEKAVNEILEQELSPLIIFTFSKQRAEEIGWHLRRKKIRLTSKAEKFVNEAFYEKIISDYLPEAERSLPQVEQMVKLLCVGIGVHHSGLLPIVKEIVELFFSEGFIKILIATETFAMGLNMPARCCLFTGVKKFDGSSSRWLTPGEYIQMSGRAGRRGLDTRGTVVLMCSTNGMGAPPPRQTLRSLLTGQTEPLNSAFRVTFHMILNMMRLEHLAVEDILRRSFHQFQHWHALAPKLKEELQRLREDVVTLRLSTEEETRIKTYLHAQRQWTNTQHNMWKVLLHSRDCAPLLQSGILIKTRRFGWCVIVESQCTFSPETGDGTRATLHCLVPFPEGSSPVTVGGKKRKKHHQRPIEIDPEPQECTVLLDDVPVEWRCLTLDASDIVAVAKVKVHLPSRTYDALQRTPRQEERQFLQPVWQDTLRAACGNLVRPGLAMKKVQMKEAQETMQRYAVEAQEIESELAEVCSGLCPNAEHCLTFPPEDVSRGIRQRHLYNTKMHQLALLEEVWIQRRLLQQDDLEVKRQVLLKLGYCELARGALNKEVFVISLKGRVACELAAAEGLDALLLTELLLDNFFHSLRPEECVAVLSCFAFEEGTANSTNNQQQTKGGKNKNKRSFTVQGVTETAEQERQVQRLDALFKVIVDKAKDVERVNRDCSGALLSSNTAVQPILALLCGVQQAASSEADYAQRLKPSLMWLSLEWARGQDFAQLMRLAQKQFSATLYEGAVIRSMRRLMEMLQQMAQAARVIANQPLEDKFLTACKAIHREVAFGKSLWSELNRSKEAKLEMVTAARSVVV